MSQSIKLTQRSIKTTKTFDAAFHGIREAGAPSLAHATRLASLAKPHADTRVPLADWLKTAQAARWTCLVDVKKSFGSADQVGACLVFNIKGNTYRLIATVVWADQHQGGTLFVKHFLTHAEYDKNTWKGCCDL